MSLKHLSVEDERLWAWVESVTGGQVINRERQQRHRPQWFVDVQRVGRVDRYLLRGVRIPGYLGDETVMRSSHRLEAQILALLADTPVKAPGLIAYEAELGWMLMEYLDGEPLITEVDDSAIRYRAYSGYMDNLALLHSLDLDGLSLPAELPRPSGSAIVSQQFEAFLAQYRSMQRSSPQPLLELGIQWINQHKLTGPRPVSLCGGDVGPNQFTFSGDKFQAMYDLEIAHLGDPMQDIGLMRCREMMYPLGGMPKHILHYFEKVQYDTSRDALEYWTVFAGVAWPLMFFEAVERPPATFIDPLFNYAYDTIHRRCIAESLMEVYEIAPQWPDLPEARETSRSTMYGLLVRQLDEKIIPDANADQQLFLSGSKALAEYLWRCDQYGQSFDRSNLDELTLLLGKQPDTLLEGLHQLEAMITTDYEQDLEARLIFLHRFQVRDEFLKAPLQKHFGFATNSPLERMDWTTP